MNNLYEEEHSCSQRINFLGKEDAKMTEGKSQDCHLSAHVESGSSVLWRTIDETRE
jgi:hypothetical protein